MHLYNMYYPCSCGTRKIITVLNVLNEEMAFLRGGAAKEGYVYNEKLGRWVYE